MRQAVGVTGTTNTPLTLWVAPSPEGEDADWSHYAIEVVRHAGTACEVASPTDPLPDAGVLVAEAAAAGDRIDELLRWVSAGNALILSGNPEGLADLTGCTAGSTQSTTKVTFASHPLWTDAPPPLRALHATALTPLGDDIAALAHDQHGSTVVAVRELGSGRVITFGVDLWLTIARIQQGFSVTADGASAADGTAPIEDDILKAEDGMALSLDEDRALPPGEPPVIEDYTHTYPPPCAVPIFDQPHADWWRAAFLQSLWHALDAQRSTPVWLGYWPAGIDAVAHMSHDADGNKTEQGEAALDAFAEADVKVTWHQVFPGGYDPQIYERVTTEGHEQSLHYNAMADADLAHWGWPQFRAQYAWAQAVSGHDRIVSNKNHYTRWEGWTEFYTWCERVGIQIDSSRGPSKQGSVGFPFGSAHVSFPLAPKGSSDTFHDVLNLPLHTQDLAWASHASVRDVILDGAAAVHGVAHFLFHGPHLHLRPLTRAACIELAAQARRRGMPWWTAEQISTWERQRRLVQVRITQDDGGADLIVQSNSSVDGAAVLIGDPDLVPADSSVTYHRVHRHGREFTELSLDLPVGQSTWRLTR